MRARARHGSRAASSALITSPWVRGYSQSLLCLPGAVVSPGRSSARCWGGFGASDAHAVGERDAALVISFNIWLHVSLGSTYVSADKEAARRGWSCSALSSPPPSPTG